MTAVRTAADFGVNLRAHLHSTIAYQHVRSLIICVVLRCVVLCILPPRLGGQWEVRPLSNHLVNLSRVLPTDPRNTITVPAPVITR